MTIQVIVVDSYQLVRRGITSILQGESHIEICGEAAELQEALVLIEEKQPQICMISNWGSSQSGLDVIGQLKQKGTDCRFVYLTSNMSPAELKQAIGLGVESIIPQGAMPEELVFAIHMISKGRKYYDYDLLKARLLEDMPKSNSLLTPKEREVLQMLSQGLSNKEIADRLLITDYTVKKHVSQILSKLDLPDRTKAALYYHNQGLRKI